MVDENNSSLWICEFCAHKNYVPGHISIPKEDKPCYFLEGAKNEKKGGKEKKEKTLLYCIDISSSMTTTFKTKTRL